MGVFLFHWYIRKCGGTLSMKNLNRVSSLKTRQKRKIHSSRPDVCVCSDPLALDSLQSGTNLRVPCFCDQKEESHKDVKRLHWLRSFLGFLRSSYLLRQQNHYYPLTWVGSSGGEREDVKPRGVVPSGQLAETQSTKLSTNSWISVRPEREQCAGNVDRPALPECNWNHPSISCRHRPLEGCSYTSQPWRPSPP